MNLLLVDDDKVDRINTIRALKSSGHPIEVAEASTAEMGLKLAHVGNFDMILLDYQLPTMDGLELLKMLRESENHRTAITMLSHSEDETLAIRCIEGRGPRLFDQKRSNRVPPDSSHYASQGALSH